MAAVAPASPSSRDRVPAAALLLIGAQRHYLYALFPDAMQADVWNVCGALAMLAFLWLAVQASKSLYLVLVALWFAAEELLVVGCSTWWLIDPWDALPGGENCSAKLGMKLGAFGITVVGWLAVQLGDKCIRKGFR